MEFLNKAATIVFATLIDNLNEEGYLKIYNDPFMPLTVERIGTGIVSPWGTGNLYSLCHYYEQNGDLMQDPEMCFFVCDERKGFQSDYDHLKIAPYLFQQANLGIYEESVRMEGEKLTVFARKLQKDHTDFANGWLRNIREQGFLIRLADPNSKQS